MFRNVSNTLLLAAAVAFLVAASTFAQPTVACGEIVLNEILADPARDWNGDGAVSTRDDEWVEIYNPGPAWIDLTGYRLAGPDSVWRYEFSGLIGPNEVKLVTGKESYDWETVNGFPAFGLRLSNSGGELVLFKVGATVVRIDSYTWKDHEADDDRSSGRGPDGGPNWILLDGLFPWTGTALPAGSGCMPSPGARLSCSTPSKPVTWSGIKTVFDR